jgi:hypothetical protein
MLSPRSCGVGPTANVRILQAGAAKPKGVWPYTICIVANPWIESPERSGQFIRDPIVGNEPVFDAKARAIVDALTGRLPGQAETMFEALAADWRIVTVFDPLRLRKSANSLVTHDNTNLVVPRQKQFPPFLRKFKLPKMGKLRADVAFAASATHDRCSAWFTLDDENSPGRPFTVDGLQMAHRQQNELPGTVALHVNARPMVPLHEFGHAGSSWTNGMVTDLYVDAGDGINKRRGRPIPGRFCVFDNLAFASAPDRGGGLATRRAGPRSTASSPTRPSPPSWTISAWRRAAAPRNAATAS